MKSLCEVVVLTVFMTQLSAIPTHGISRNKAFLLSQMTDHHLSKRSTDLFSRFQGWLTERISPESTSTEMPGTSFAATVIPVSSSPVPPSIIGRVPWSQQEVSTHNLRKRSLQHLGKIDQFILAPHQQIEGILRRLPGGGSFIPPRQPASRPYTKYLTPTFATYPKPINTQYFASGAIPVQPINILEETLSTSSMLPVGMESSIRPWNPTESTGLGGQVGATRPSSLVDPLAATTTVSSSEENATHRTTAMPMTTEIPSRKESLRLIDDRALPTTTDISTSSMPFEASTVKHASLNTLSTSGVPESTTHDRQTTTELAQDSRSGGSASGEPANPDNREMTKSPTKEGLISSTPEPPTPAQKTASTSLNDQLHVLSSTSLPTLEPRSSEGSGNLGRADTSISATSSPISGSSVGSSSTTRSPDSSSQSPPPSFASNQE